MLPCMLTMYWGHVLLAARITTLVPGHAQMSFILLSSAGGLKRPNSYYFVMCFASAQFSIAPWDLSPETAALCAAALELRKKVPARIHPCILVAHPAWTGHPLKPLSCRKHLQRCMRRKSGFTCFHMLPAR